MRELTKVYTVKGNAYIDLSQIIAIMPSAQRDSYAYALLISGDKIPFDNYNLQKLISQLKLK